MTLAYCWSQFRRLFYDIAKGGNAPIADQILARIAMLYAIEDAIRGPIFMHDAGRIIADHWAVGFMRGISLRVQQWADVLLTDLRLTLAPIFVSHDMGAGFLPDIPKAEQLRRRPTAHQQIAEAVVALRQACTSKRSASFKPTKTRRQRPPRIPRQ